MNVRRIVLPVLFVLAACGGSGNPARDVLPGDVVAVDVPAQDVPATDDGAPDATVVPDTTPQDADVDVEPSDLAADPSEEVPVDVVGPDGLDVAIDAVADIEPDDADVPVEEVADAGPDVTSPSGWSVQVADDAPKFKSRAAVAVGKDGAVHLAYNVASSEDGWLKPDLWYAVLRDGVWTREVAYAAGGVSNEFPVIVLDPSDRPVLLFNRWNEAEQQVDVFRVSRRDGGGFDEPVRVTATADRDEFGPVAAFDALGDLHVAYQLRRVFDPQFPAYYAVGYSRVAADGSIPVPGEEIEGNTLPPSLNPAYSLAVDRATGKVHVVYCIPDDSGLLGILTYRVRDELGWSVGQELTAKTLDVWDPSIAVDGTGGVHVVYTISPDWDTKTLEYLRIGDAAPQPLTTTQNDRSYYLGLAAASDGAVHVAFGRLLDGNMDLFYRTGRDGTFQAEQRISDTPALDESSPAIALDKDGRPVVSFVENLSAAPAGKVYVAFPSD